MFNLEPEVMKTQTHPEPLNILIIIASVRTGRVGEAIGGWVRNHLGDRTDVMIDVVDVAETDVPDERGLQPGDDAPATTALLAAADAYVVVSPEYNHGYPAALKRFIDAHYSPWRRKTALVVSYGGGSGGVFAAEQLRGVFAELDVATTRRGIHLVHPWERLRGRFDAGEEQVRALHAATADLLWWARALRAARRQDAAREADRGADAAAVEVSS